MDVDKSSTLLQSNDEVMMSFRNGQIGRP